MVFMVARQVPVSSAMALPHGPAGVADARRRMRKELCSYGTPEHVIDDAVLIISELLSNSYRYARPLPDRDAVRAAWRLDENALLTVEVTDGGGPTRPLQASPSLTARGGRGLGIVGHLALRWGVRDAPGQVTVWATLPTRGRGEPAASDAPMEFADPFGDL